jgi:sensor c-di-GMP phosphodiesterase-like protein
LLIKSRNLVVQIALVLAGAGLGTVIAWSVVRALQLRTGQAELTRYAHHLQQNADGIALEVNTTLNTIRSDNLPFCSDQEIAYMRKIVYNSTHIKDIGRNRNGHLECTANIGRFASSPPLQAPDVVTRDMNIFIDWPLLISPAAKGIIVEYHGTSVVLNPDSYNVLDQPPMVQTGLIYDRQGERVYRVFGHEEPLSSAEVIAQRPVERDGVVYQPLCSATYSACTVASEPRGSLMARDEMHFLGFLIGGGLLGGAFSLSVILIFSRQRTFQRRLRRAVRKGQLTVAYQPIVDLATGSIVGAEALARWTNDSAENVPPELFIAVAERRGFIHEITRFMIHRTIEEIGQLLHRENFRVTINITAMDLRDPSFFTTLDECLSHAGIHPSAIGLELTERSTAEQSLMTDALARLKAAGYTVYVDDFGTGYSSLAYLHQLEIDAIKIDRTFTSTVGTEAVTASVVPQILDMARRLDLKVVVEGIETTEQAEYFRRAGQGILGQGWLFGKPVPAAEFKRLFKVVPARTTATPHVQMSH